MSGALASKAFPLSQVNILAKLRPRVERLPRGSSQHIFKLARYPGSLKLFLTRKAFPSDNQNVTITRLRIVDNCADRTDAMFQQCIVQKQGFKWIGQS